MRFWCFIRCHILKRGFLNRRVPVKPTEKIHLGEGKDAGRGETGSAQPQMRIIPLRLGEAELLRLAGCAFLGVTVQVNIGLPHVTLFGDEHLSRRRCRVTRLKPNRPRHSCIGSMMTRCKNAKHAGTSGLPNCANKSRMPAQPQPHPPDPLLDPTKIPRIPSCWQSTTPPHL